MYLLVVNGDNGSVPALPYAGGFMEQPYRTLQVFETIQGKFWEKLSEDNNKLQKIGSNG